jgi:hypothetical protein
MRDTPELSIVVASWSSDESLARCLSSLAPQWDGAEIIVATNRPEGDLERRYPQVRFLRAPDAASVFRLRTLGATAARGHLVALVEDHAAARPCWAAALRKAYREGHRIIGGPVENGLQAHAVDWALYFVEYGYYMPPMHEGPAARLSGLNIAYDRELLDSCRVIWNDTLQENEINDALGAKGYAPYLAPDAIVESHLPMTLGHAMSHLRDGGCHFARYRASRCSRVKRLFWATASPLVPVVLFFRLARAIASRRPRRLLELMRALPFLVPVLLAWGRGETTGYLTALRDR